MASAGLKIMRRTEAQLPSFWSAQAYPEKHQPEQSLFELLQSSSQSIRVQKSLSQAAMLEWQKSKHGTTRHKELTIVSLDQAFEQLLQAKVTEDRMENDVHNPRCFLD